MATAAVARHHQHRGRGAPSRAGPRRAGIRCSSSPAQEFAALAAVFRRRLVVGATTAAAAAVGANFGGVTSFLLGLSPELGRSLRLDVLYPVGGFTRCLDSDNGFGKRADLACSSSSSSSPSCQLSNCHLHLLELRVVDCVQLFCLDENLR